MASSLMSIFDPSSTLLLVELPLKWMLVVMFAMVMCTQYWVIPSNINLVMVEVMNFLHSQISPGTGPVFKKSFILLMSLFSTVLLSNLSGLLPYSWAVTSHMAHNFSICFTLWVSGVIWVFMNMKVYNFLSHMYPKGVSLGLVPLVLVTEVMGVLIKPVSLSVRLTANIVAGHILMHLFESMLPVVASTLVLYIYTLFEVMIAFIQSYVVMSLMFLYWEETYDC